MKVAVSGVNNVDNPGPGVPVVRGIKDSHQFDGEIIGLIYDALEPGMYLSKIKFDCHVIITFSLTIEEMKKLLFI